MKTISYSNAQFNANLQVRDKCYFGGLTIPRLTVKKAKDLLEPYLISYSEEDDIQSIFEEVLKSIELLPVGCFFSLSTIVKNTDKTKAYFLGIMLREASAAPDARFDFGKTCRLGVYRRNNKKSELSRDFIIEY